MWFTSGNRDVAGLPDGLGNPGHLLGHVVVAGVRLVPGESPSPSTKCFAQAPGTEARSWSLFPSTRRITNPPPKAPTVFVTHDQAEVMSLSDRIAVFMHGHLQHVGTPTETYEPPATPEVAGFISRCNLLEGRVDSTEGGPVQTELGETGQPWRVARVCSAGSSATVGPALGTHHAHRPRGRPARRCRPCATGEDRTVFLHRSAIRVRTQHRRSPYRSDPKPSRGRSHRLRPHTTPTGT